LIKTYSMRHNLQAFTQYFFSPYYTEINNPGSS
jgi:hypothetical protein